MRVDNVGAIFTSKNNTATVRTRHVDARYHFVREYIAKGYIKIIFVKTEDNLSDGFTKNVTQEVYNQHAPTYLQEKSTFEMDSN